MKFFKSFSIFGVMLVVLLSAPLLFRGGNPKCSFDGANAQDNPCLAQEATISAMNVALLQATLDTMSYQATITALQNTVGSSVVPSNVESPIVVAGLPFTETFDNNDRGWQLTATEFTSSTFSRGALNLRITKSNICEQIPIPNVSNQQFYVEIDVTPSGIDDDSRRNFGFVGFALGTVSQEQNTNSNSQTAYFLFGRPWNDSWRAYGFITDDERVVLANSIYADSDANIWQIGDTVKIGLGVENGFYTLYFNGEALESTQITLDNTEVGLALCGHDIVSLANYRHVFSARFDNLVVRQSR